MRLKREIIVEKALELLNEVGLDEFTTRRLANRLGIQSPTLYWHFKSKRALLDAMAYAMLKDHETRPVPSDMDWRGYWRKNAHSLRRALLAYRDGARVHAGTMPSVNQLPRAEAMMRLMCSHGYAPEEALSIIIALSRFVVGWVLEEQAAASRNDDQQSFPSQEDFPLLSKAWSIAKVQGSDRAFDLGLLFFLGQIGPGDA